MFSLQLRRKLANSTVRLGRAVPTVAKHPTSFFKLAGATVRKFASEAKANNTNIPQILPWKGVFKDACFVKEIDRLMAIHSLPRFPNRNYFKPFEYSWREGFGKKMKHVREGWVSVFEGMGALRLDWRNLPNGLTLEGSGKFPVIEKVGLIGTAQGSHWKKHDLWPYSKPVSSTDEVLCYYRLNTSSGKVDDDLGIWGADTPEGMPLDIVRTAKESVEALGAQASEFAIKQLEQTTDQHAMFTALANVLLLNKLDQCIPRYFNYQNTRFPTHGWASYILFDGIYVDVTRKQLDIRIKELGLGLTVLLRDTWPVTIRANISGDILINSDLTITHNLKWTGPYNGVPIEHRLDFSRYIPRSVPIGRRINWDTEMSGTVAALSNNFQKNVPHFIEVGLLPSLNIARQLSLDSSLTLDNRERISFVLAPK